MAAKKPETAKLYPLRNNLVFGLNIQNDNIAKTATIFQK